MDEIEYFNLCRDCGWFDPAYDICQLHGKVTPDDKICDSFIVAED